MTSPFFLEWSEASGRKVCLVQTYVNKANWAFFMSTHGPFHDQHDQHEGSLLKLTAKMALIISKIILNFDQVDLSGIRNGANIAGQVSNDMKRLRNQEEIRKLIGIHIKSRNVYVFQFIIFFSISKIAIDPVNIPIPGTQTLIGIGAAKHVQIVFTSDEKYGVGHANVRIRYQATSKHRFKEDIFRATAAKEVALIAEAVGGNGRMAGYDEIDHRIATQLDGRIGEVLIGIHTIVGDGRSIADSELRITREILRAIQAN